MKVFLPALFALVGIFAIGVFAHEPLDGVLMDDLRGEVAQLRQRVAELTKKIEAMEYRGLPRATDDSPGNSSSKFVNSLPPGEPSGSKLRFPLDVERGTWRHQQIDAR